MSSASVMVLASITVKKHVEHVSERSAGLAGYHIVSEVYYFILLAAFCSVKY